jgi:hypothetical protein
MDNYEIESLPNEILAPHMQYLHYRQESQPTLVEPSLLQVWSEHLSVFLNLPTNTVNEKLTQLYHAYLGNNLDYCLSIVNTLPAFPGYPFMIKFDFAAHINYVNHYFNQTINNPIPKIPFIAFHKSASSYISGVLCRLFKVNPTVISFNHLKGMPAWIGALGRWGGVLHDHYYPSPSNLELLRSAGIRQCIIHDRHPVDAMISLANHWVDHQLKPDSQQFAGKDAHGELVEL